MGKFLQLDWSTYDSSGNFRMMDILASFIFTYTIDPTLQRITQICLVYFSRMTMQSKDSGTFQSHPE